MIQDHEPIPIDKFLGLYGIDDFDDSVPVNYFIDELNNITEGSQLRTRDGVDIDLSTSGIIQFAIYRRQGEQARVIALIGETIWDLTTNTAIYTAVGMTGFAINYYNNRAFISPHNGSYGLPGKFVQVYDGVGTTRDAGGIKSSAGFVVTPNGTGTIEKGMHLFAWAFETSSGFVTEPTDSIAVEFAGGTAVDFSNIPLGPVGTVARRLIASRSIQDYNGNPLAYEMFFVSGGRIADNATTNLTGIDFYDVDLQFSADYLWDQLSRIPAVVFICTYGNRMCYGSTAQDKNIVYISNMQEPERIHNTAGFISFDPFETEGVKDGTQFRDNLYVCKRNKTYTIRDNTFEPATWGNPVTLDSAIGCDLNGIARYYDATGSRVEFFTVTSPAGLYKFQGVYEEIPLSRNIKHIVWKQINMNLLHKCVSIVDQERMLLYLLLPIGDTDKTNTLIVGNFEDGLNFKSIKWHKWQFAPFVPSCIGIDRLPNRKTTLKLSSLTGNIYLTEPHRRLDVEDKISCWTRFALINMRPNNIHHYGAVGFRMKGKGLLGIKLFGQDKVDNQTLPSINLNCVPGKEFMSLAHFQSEKCSVYIENAEAGDYYLINRINLYTNIIFGTRPLV